MLAKSPSSCALFVSLALALAACAGTQTPASPPPSGGVGAAPANPAPPSNATQAPTTPAAPGPMARHQQMMSAMMKDMAQQMSAMADRMGHGDITAGQERQMGREMQGMSGMMHRMSGMASHPNMRDPDFQKQLGRMRQQMNDMMHSPSTNARGKEGSQGRILDAHGHE